MFKRNQAGAIDGLTLLFIVIVIVGAFFWFNRKDETKDPASEQESSDFVEVPDNAVSSEGLETKSTTLSAINGYSGTGKASYTYSPGKYTIKITAALPNPFETTYYEALLKGSSTINLGQMTKEGGSYVASYSASRDLRPFKNIEINVVKTDSAAILDLPLEAMKGSF